MWSPAPTGPRLPHPALQRFTPVLMEEEVMRQGFRPSAGIRKWDRTLRWAAASSCRVLFSTPRLVPLCRHQAAWGGEKDPGRAGVP